VAHHSQEELDGYSIRGSRGWVFNVSPALLTTWSPTDRLGTKLVKLLLDQPHCMICREGYGRWTLIWSCSSVTHPSNSSLMVLSEIGEVPIFQSWWKTLLIRLSLRIILRS